MRHLALLFAALVGIAACGEHEPTGTALPGLLSDSTEVTPDAAQLLQAKARWAAERNARDYAFVTRYFCHCSSDGEVQVRVSVEDAEVVAVREVTSGRSRAVMDYYTIESLFDQAIEARGSGVRVRVTYASGGYPAWLTIGEPERDAGVTYHIEEVRLR